MLAYKPVSANHLFDFQKNVAELFKNEIKIKDLPPIKINRTKPQPKEDLSGLTELFDPDKSSEVA